MAGKILVQILSFDWRNAAMTVLQGKTLLKGNACAPIQILDDPLNTPSDEAPVILVCDELSLSRALSLKNVAAVVSHQGSPNGHVSVVLKSAGIPWVSGILPQKSWRGHLSLLEDGRLFLDPPSEALKRHRENVEQRQKRLERILSESDKPLQTAAGQPIRIFAAINSLAQADEAIQSGAEGVGLLRSECLFPDVVPDEETQYWAYRTLINRAGGRTCVVRALDADADKPLPYLSQTGNARGIQCLLCHPDVFRVQLRALLRASAHGPLGVLLPFVQSLEEWHACLQLIKECRSELSYQAAGRFSLGAMLETPRAASLCGSLAREADFLCIGSGDLVAHALSISREDTRYAPDHPNVRALIRRLSCEADDAGCPIGLCGVLADEPSLAADALSLGVRQFVVSPTCVPWVRESLQKALNSSLA